MKPTCSVIVKSIFGAAIVLVAACKQPAPESKTTTAPAAGDKPQIVYVNQDTLLSKYDYFKDMNKRLTERGSSAQSDAASKEQAYQREVIEYQKAANTMPADQRQTTEQRLMREKQQLQTYEQNAGAQVQQEQQSEQLKLLNKLSDFMKGYAKEKGYKMILTYQHNNTAMLYGDPSMDVTADVLKRLNEAYGKDKK